MDANKITKIEIWSRGKNKDIYGNPYHAFKAVLTFSYVSYFHTITISMGMTYGDSGEWDCLKWACAGIKEALGITILPNDERIVHHHKRVSHDCELEYPNNWKV